MLDYRIYTFLAVCRHFNYTKAAKELCLTQPAVSCHIKQLEEEYHTTFFTYQKKTLRLTAAGELFLQKALVLANDEKRLKKTLTHLPERTTSFTLGVTTTIGEYVIAKPFARLIKERPSLSLSLIMGNTNTLLDALQNGTIDFAIVEGNFSPSLFNSRLYSQEKFVLVTHKEHHFNHPPESLEDLFDQRLLLREKGSGTRNILEKTLSVYNHSVNDFAYTTCVSSMYTILQLLYQDCGISFLYQTAAKEGIALGILQEITLPDFCVHHDFSFVWNKDSIYEKEFLDIYNALLPEPKIT